MMVGKSLNKNAYVDYLTNLMAMMDASFLDTTASQASYTAKISGADVLSGALNIAFSDLLLGRMDDVKKSYELISGGGKFASLGLDMVQDMQQLVVFSSAASLHNQKVTVLETIRDNTSDKNLKAAAEDAIHVCNLELIYICDNYAVSLATEAAKFDNNLLNMTVFKNAMPGMGKKIADGFTSWLKSISAGNTSGTAAKLIAFGGNFAKNFKHISFGITVGTELGKLIFGSDYELYRESIAMDRISDALITGFHIARSSADSGDYQAITEYAAIGKALTVAHLRGDYCYTHSAAPRNDEKAEKYYEAAALNLSAYAAALEEIFAPQSLTVVHEEFELYNGFIVPVEQKTEVPEGYTPIYSYEDLKKISIPTADDLKTLRVDDYRDVKGIVMEDFYMPDGYDSIYRFYGELDGNGHMIHNVSKPLFEQMMGGQVRNLGLVLSGDLEITTGRGSDQGAIAGNADTSKDEDCAIDNCYTIGALTIDHDTKTSTIRAGGLIGSGHTTAFSNCYNEADITVNSNRDAYIGGLVGDGGIFTNSYNRGDITVKSTGSYAYYTCNAYAGGIGAENVELYNGYNMGNITAQGKDITMAGGITAYAWMRESSDNCHLVNCYNTGTITASSEHGSHAGGIAAKSYGVAAGERLGGKYKFNGAYIVNCMNTGDVTAPDTTGGILGIMSGTIIQNCCNTAQISGGANYSGGIVGAVHGSDHRSFLVKCYNAGSVSGGKYVGSLAGIIGDIDGNEDQSTKNPEQFIIDCYYLENGVEPHNNGPVKTAEALSAEEMANQDSFPAFDFGIVWKMDPDSGFSYPRLRHKEFTREDLIVPSIED